jgi:CheY-like chemotaxis protein
MQTRRQPSIPTALVLHHDQWARTHLMDELSTAGYRVLAASNGFSGLRLVEQQQPELILLSHTLPELSGHEVLDRLRADVSTRDIPVLIVGGSSGVRASLAEMPSSPPRDAGRLLRVEQVLDLDSTGARRMPVPARV